MKLTKESVIAVVLNSYVRKKLGDSKLDLRTYDYTSSGIPYLAIGIQNSSFFSNNNGRVYLFSYEVNLSTLEITINENPDFKYAPHCNLLFQELTELIAEFNKHWVD